MQHTNTIKRDYFCKSQKKNVQNNCAKTLFVDVVRFFQSSGSFLTLSTIETMSGRLRTGPEPPPKPSYALGGFFRRRRSCRASGSAIRTTENGLMAVHKSVHLCRTGHKRCAREAMQLLLQQHPEDITINSSVDAEGWGSCTGATDEEKEEAVQWITYPILLIGREDRWPPNATNATTNRRRESKGPRTIC